MKGIDLSLLQRVLDALEEQENALLVWGDTGGFFNLDELLSVIGRVLPDEDAEVVLDQMLEAAMLIQVPHVSGTPVWRTRMGRRSISCATCASGCISKNWTRAKRWYRTIALFAGRAAIPTAFTNRQR